MFNDDFEASPEQALNQLVHSMETDRTGLPESLWLKRKQLICRDLVRLRLVNHYGLGPGIGALSCYMPSWVVATRAGRYAHAITSCH